MDVNSMFLQNVGIYLLVYMAPKPRRTASSSSLLWKPQISTCNYYILKIYNHKTICIVLYAFSAGIVICNWCVTLSILITVWCTFDAAGRSWVKMKKYQRSMREAESRFQYKRSGTRHRNWRQR
jgi:hypothetical protein